MTWTARGRLALLVLLGSGLLYIVTGPLWRLRNFVPMGTAMEISAVLSVLLEVAAVLVIAGFAAQWSGVRGARLVFVTIAAALTSTAAVSFGANLVLRLFGPTGLQWDTGIVGWLVWSAAIVLASWLLSLVPKSPRVRVGHSTGPQTNG